MFSISAYVQEISNIEVSPIMLTCVIVLSYLVGNISPAIILGKIYKIDVRKEGSGNAGTTNVLRTVGKKAAVITLVVDILKGAIVVIISSLIGGTGFSLICGLAVILGHIYPVVHGFKGGKGVATTCGVILAFDFTQGLIIAGLAVVVILLSKRVSVGALVGALAFPITMYWFHPTYFSLSLVFTIIVWAKHRENIKRLAKGEEPKLSLFNKK